jgi:hypothetical protein
MTATTQQSGLHLPEPLNDREFDILRQAEEVPPGTIRSMEDVATWLDDGGGSERLGERARPYVFIEGDGDSARVRFTALGDARKREREERERREQEESAKGMRDRFVHHPTTAGIKHIQVKVGRINIDEDETSKSTEPR